MSGCSINGFMSATEARIKAGNDGLIYSEICAIEQEIISASHSCDGNGLLSTIINGQTPITSAKGITSVDVIRNGSHYVLSSPTVSITSVTGTGFIGTAIVNGQGVVTGINVVDAGTAYELGDVITVTHPQGSTGSSVVATVTLVTELMSFGGSFSPGFTSASGSTTGAATVGEIIGITVTDGGTGYKDTPYVRMVDPEGTGSGFESTVVINSTDNSIASVTVVNAGRNYSANSTPVIVGDVLPTGEHAVITAKTQSSSFRFNPDSVHYHSVWAGLQDDLAVKIQLDTIQKYFTNLGYNFIIQTNPSTMDTLQYKISW